MKLLLICMTALIASLAGAEEAPRVLLPQPPQQQQPAPMHTTKLPEKMVSAAEFLFQLSLADPRGCEYREIEVLASGWHGSMNRNGKIHGWVLPEKAGTAQRFAICWNGLIYPAVSVGAAADCREDMQRLLKHDEETSEKRLAEHTVREEQRAKEAQQRGHTFYPSSSGLRFRNELERSSIEQNYMTRMKAIMSLRLGHVELAESLWSRWNIGNPEKADADPFVEIAEEWVRALGQQAIYAHARADDGLALYGLRLLNKAQARIESEADKRGLKPMLSLRKGVQHLHLPSQLPELLADQERRAKDGPRERILPRGPRNVIHMNLDGTPAKFVAPPELNNYPDTPKRIAALIRDLELIDDRGHEVTPDPTLRALIAEGDTAIEPLLACLESDTRMTRSIGYQMRVVVYDTIVPVHTYANRALSEILQLKPDIEMWDAMKAKHGAGYYPSDKEQRNWFVERFRKEAARIPKAK